MISRFVKGSRTLNINSGRYVLGTDYIPPTTAIAAQIAIGTAANTYGGGRKIGEKAQPADFSFTVMVHGSAVSEVNRGVSDLTAFLRGAGDENEPLYYECQTADLAEPLWGQFGAPLRYKVIHASTFIQSGYQNTYTKLARVTVTLTLNPLAEGRKQRLANALGGIFEDTLGMADGQSRGLVIPEATTNKMTNPVFSHATFGNGWTAAANVVAAQNTDARFIGWGLNSAKLTSVHDTTNNTYTQSIAAGNTNKHTFTAWVKKQDSSAVTASDCVIYYGAAKTSTFTLVGDGIYKIQAANVDGIAAATATGLQVKAGKTVYLLGFQMEENARGTPLAYGELLGDAWNPVGSPHATKTDRTAGQVKLTIGADDFLVGSGSIAVVWKADYASTASGNSYFFSDAGAKIYALFNDADDKIYLGDGTATVATAAQTFAAGDVLHLVFTWGPGGKNIYKNGANIATIAAFTPPAVQASLSIGTDKNGANPADGLFMGFTIYDRELTLAEVQAIYNAAVLLTADGQAVDRIPWLWTKDGDGVVDNCNDSTHDNFAVAGGVVGSEEARTLYDCQLSAGFNSIKSVYLSKLGYKTFINPSNFYVESPDDTADAGSSGGYYDESSVLNALPKGGSATLSPMAVYALAGKYFTALARSADDSTARSAQLRFAFNSASVVTAYTSLTQSNTFKLIKCPGSLQFPDLKHLHLADGLDATARATIGMFFRNDGSEELFRIDYIAFLIYPILRISDTISDTGFIAEGTNAQSYTVAGRLVGPTTLSVNGDAVELEPGKYNHLISAMGDSSVDPVITWTMTYYGVYVTPRWSLV